jgi:TatD DNase family protein
MIEFVDTHCHLQDDAFGRDADETVLRARAAGVTAMVVCGYDAAANLAAMAMARKHAGVYPTVGFHPHEAATVTSEMLRELEGQAARAEVVAVGEIGLDFYRDHSPRDIQASVLDEQLEIALRVRKPVSIHSRGAEDAIEPSLRRYAARQAAAFGSRPVGVMHCFGGTLEQAQCYVDLGFLISITCTITYPSNAEGRRLAAALPLESLVIETDSPYLPPQTHRGKRNEPALVVAAAGHVAALRGISTAALAERTSRNAARLFAIPVHAGELVGAV